MLIRQFGRSQLNVLGISNFLHQSHFIYALPLEQDYENGSDQYQFTINDYGNFLQKDKP